MTKDSTLLQSIADLESAVALQKVKDRLREGEDPNAILADCREGLNEVGKRFESSEYFIADLTYAAHIFEQIMEVLTPELEKTAQPEKAGKVVIATVKDDIHDIGKNLVAAMLKAGGFDVNDLGINVEPAKICKTIKDQRPDVVALSCLLTAAIDSMEDTITEIGKAGLRDQVKILVGGIPLSADLARRIGADGYGDDANDAVKQCRKLVEGQIQ